MNNINRFLIISPDSTYKSKFHFKKLISIFHKKGIDSKIVDSMEYTTKFLDLKKIKTHKKFNTFLNEYNPDLILLDSHPFELINSIINKKIPYLFLLRGNIWEEEKWARETICKSFKQRLALKRKHRIYETCMNHAFVIIPISHFLKNIVQQKFPNKKIKVIHIDARVSEEWTTKTNMKLKHPCIGLVQGAGIWGKTKEMMILPKIIEKMPHVTFYWAGDGIYKDKILPLLENFENFNWVGNLDYPDKVQEFLSEIDIYALFSGMDGLGQSVIEASLMEKPVIATNSGGIPETIENGKTGFLIESGDTQEWVNKISLILENSEISRKLGMNGKKFVVKKFNWEIISDEIIELVNKQN
jgi:glycosyltransferase involved in cell wall biosynthesis